MKLRTSFFNLTVLKKDITRFAPLWGLYTVFMLLFLLLIGGTAGTDVAEVMLNSASGIMSGMSLINLVYCGMAAMLLFGDLCNTRLCNALHAMPLRREGWFLTHLTAGFLLCMGPNIIGALVAAGMMGQNGYGAFIWLAVMALQFLFFFGVGVFCMLCAGNRLGAVAMYSLINFLSVLAAWLVKMFYEPMLYGIELDLEGWAKLSPAVGMTGKGYIETHYDNMRSVTVFEGFVAEDWRYLFIAAAVGLVLLVLALVIYRKRDLETAGDFISAKPAAPVFLVLYTLCVGAILKPIGELASQTAEYIFLAVGLAVGFFTGSMLLERKVHVFRKRTFLNFGVLVAALAVTVGLTWLDPAGVTRYVPETDQVESVQVGPYDNWYTTSSARALTDPADIQAVTQLHTDLVTNREIPGENEDAFTVSLRYTMKDGTTLNRRYLVSADGPSTRLLRTVGSRPEMVLGTADMEDLLKNLYELCFYPYSDELPEVVMSINENWLDTEVDGENAAKFGFDGSFLGKAEAEALVRALEADCRAGNMAQHWSLHQSDEQVGYITMQVRLRNGALEYRDMIIYESCENTVACLKRLAPGK